MITHYDLFAGIGGFSLALEEVFDEPIRHIFCEWEDFPTKVLKKHWPDGEYWGDIAELVAHTASDRRSKQSTSLEDEKGYATQSRNARQLAGRPERLHWTIVTGGFPCQPFSAAGRRRGTSDDRYKWPEMFEVIRNVQPDWVIAENVRGLVNWSDGLVLEQVCSDLESEGYEVQPLIIPAVAVNAPHRRDRVWIIANRRRIGQTKQEQQTARGKQQDRDAPNTSSKGLERQSGREPTLTSGQRPSWERNWPEVAAELCLVDDGLSSQLVRLPDGSQISYPRWRKESLKAGGNAIVPQVAMEIFRAIKAQLAKEEGE